MSESPTEIGAAEAARLLEAGEAVLLDVREPYEWAAGHAPDATHVPMGELALDRVPPGSPLLVVCHVGGRSMQVVGALRRHGIEAVNVAGGMEAWHAAGLPVIVDTGEPGQVV